MILDFISKFKNPNVVKLHGYDMNVWDYLGYSTFTYTYTDTPTVLTCNVHLFQKKGDPNLRDFYMETGHMKKFIEHPAMSNVHLWKGLQLGLFSIINTWPSAFTREHHAKKSLFWDDTKKEWVFKDINSDNVVRLFEK